MVFLSILSLSTISLSDTWLLSANSFSMWLKKFLFRWITMITALFKRAGKSFTIWKISLKEPADPPNNNISELLKRAIISLSIANFLINVFFLIYCLKLHLEY